jgi:hypothetical protein
VVVYDRDGANKDFIFNSKYGRGTLSSYYEDLHYYDYTIRGLLDPSMKGDIVLHVLVRHHRRLNSNKCSGITYDNTELNKRYNDSDKASSRRQRFESQGHDKTLTFTQCRLAANCELIYTVIHYDESYSNERELLKKN